ncbi:hypothetical protein Q6348_06660 [Isoptericola sp. b441]|uniref:Histidinol dehydrogenase n=1 Tax=Actinotalea lenta TaxID=3064654 RepID=A0ABT9D7Q2_9CELL|nr:MULTISPECIES: hypothetical protein [unclassified Isoptericola]MDO8106877.1 hypothetical protein [Isoptericola sp. b441]MDO8121413.1 hypothetical protein [Isoptericola sp. b490]
MDTPPARALARWAGMFLVGVLVGIVGTSVHRLARPWGLLLALALVLLGGVVGRAWAGAVAVLAVGLGVVTATGVLGVQGPGGDVLIAADGVGYVWYAGALVVAGAYLLPRSWFRESPPSRSPHT